MKKMEKVPQQDVAPKTGRQKIAAVAKLRRQVAEIEKAKLEPEQPARERGAEPGPKRRLSKMNVAMFNTSPIGGFFGELSKWLGEHDYFKERSAADAYTETAGYSPEWWKGICEKKIDFLFVNETEPEKLRALCSEIRAQPYNANVKVVLFTSLPATRLDAMFGAQTPYDILYDPARKDRGYARLRGYLAQLS